MNSKLYVGNLSLETTQTDLREAFEPFGTVVEVYIASDRYTGRPRGFAFVTFDTDEGAKLATEKLNGTALNGRELKVGPAKPSGFETGTTESGAVRTFSSPNRKAGAFHARGKRRH